MAKMNGELFKLLQRPELWERSTAPFWDDEHISEAMLEAHLNPDWDAASRKLETIESSVRWISTVLPPHSRLLDLGCGPGLYCKRFSALGYEVTGVDLSERSLRYAGEHDPLTSYIRQNYLELTYREAFDAVTMIYCDYAALTLPERHSLLERIHAALKPGGVFLFDVFSNVYFRRKAEGKSWSVNPDGGFWSGEPHIELAATYLYEAETVSVDQSVILTQDSVTEYLIWDTDYDLKRLTEEIAPFGFTVKAAFDDVCGTPYTGSADTLCLVAVKAEP